MLCKWCGMESETTDRCSWCGRPMAAPAEGEAEPEQATPQTPPPAAPRPRPPGPVVPPPVAEGTRLPPTAPPATAAPPQPPSAMPTAAPTKSTRTIIIVASIVVGVVLVFVGLIVAVQKSQEKVRPPKEWTTYTSKEDLFSVEIPKGWSTSERSAHGTDTHVWIKQSSFVRFEVDASLITSVIGDVAPGTGHVGELLGATKRESRTVRTHRFFADLRKDAMKGAHYAETEPTVTRIGGKEAAASECTFKGKGYLYRPRMKGKRITILQRDRGYTLLAVCPEDQYAKFEPIMDRMLGSFKFK